ncbi:MAG TPA: hypothetical protein VMT95_15685 [Candidatus Binatia bacterium]|nr:hypothetical protein [Candidatus Binatia bacterium]
MAFLAGCGVLQPPIGAPGAMLQSPAQSAPARSGFVGSYRVLHDFGQGADGQGPTGTLLDVLCNSIRGVFAQRRIQPVDIISGAPALKVTMKPDITIMNHERRPILVMDVKYRKPILFGREEYGPTFNSSSIYQILAYAEACRCEGMLIYPQFGEQVDVTMKLNDITFGITTIDLSKDVRSSFKCFSDRIQQKLLPEAA